MISSIGVVLFCGTVAVANSSNMITIIVTQTVEFTTIIIVNIIIPMTILVGSVTSINMNMIRTAMISIMGIAIGIDMTIVTAINIINKINLPCLSFALSLGLVIALSKTLPSSTRIS